MIRQYLWGHVSNVSLDQRHVKNVPPQTCFILMHSYLVPGRVRMIVVVRNGGRPSLEIQLKGQFAEEIESLLQDVLASKSASPSPSKAAL